MTQRGKDFDPFLHIDQKNIIDETNNFFVIPARSPYTKDHLLVIPKKRANLLKELTQKEQMELFIVLEDRTEKLHTKHKSVNLLLRDGLVGWKSGKSVNHLHFHLIPDLEIGSKKVLSDSSRIWYDDDDYQNITNTIIANYKI